MVRDDDSELCMTWQYTKGWVAKRKMDEMSHTHGKNRGPMQVSPGMSRFEITPKAYTIHHRSSTVTTGFSVVNISLPTTVVPFIGQVGFVSDEHDDDVTSSLRSDVINPL